MSEVKNCHYVPRLLTRPWEAKDRHLHYFDLRTSKMDRAPSSTLFAKAGLHTTATERKLQKLIEDSVGKYKQRCAKAGGRLVDPGEENSRETRALIGLFAFQGARTGQALRDAQLKYTVDEMLADERAFDWLVDQFARDFSLIGGALPAGDWMCFPSVGFFSIPVMDQPPALAIPLTPRTFLTLYPRGAIVESGVGDMVRTKTMIAAFSMLGGGLEHKLVVPAQIAENNQAADLAKLLETQRVLGRRLYNLIGEAAVVAGLRGYGYNEKRRGRPLADARLGP